MFKIVILAAIAARIVLYRILIRKIKKFVKIEGEEKDKTKAMLRNAKCEDCFFVGKHVCTHESISDLLVESNYCLCNYKYFIRKNIDERALSEYERFKKELHK